jgi:DHA1 family bicyclomycin/chloramphenicol resistance-like MFS transporter
MQVEPLVRTPARAGAATVVILGLLSTFGPLSIDMYLPGLPDLVDDLDSSAALGQLTLTACMLGLALGQLVAGPLSDAWGRRRPLLIGLVGFFVASAVCAAAPTIGALIFLRFLQGAAGAFGIVIARAIVRDLHEGTAAVRYFSALMLVTGVAPVLAPVLGGQLLEVTSWRGIFVALAIVGAVMLVATALGLGETLPEERRREGGLRATATTLREVLSDRRFVAYALACGLAFGAMFTYISGSPFVIQDLYGASPQLFSAAFALNSLGIVAAGQVNGRLAGHVAPRTMLGAGVGTMAVAGLVLLAVTIPGDLGVVALLVPLWVLVSCIGFVIPNATALALADHREVAGSASALLGVTQFLIGAAVAPLAGIAGTGTAVPMAVAMAALSFAAVAAWFTAR